MSASCSRLVVGHLARDNIFSSLAQVREELAGAVSELASDKLPNKYQVPFFSAGSEQVGDRVEMCRSQSTLSDQFVIDVCLGEDTVRTLISILTHTSLRWFLVACWCSTLFAETWC